MIEEYVRERKRILEEYDLSPEEIKELPNYYLNDTEIAYNALTHDGNNLEYFSYNIRNNKYLVTIAVENTENALGFASEELKENVIFIISLIRNENISSLIFERIPKRLQRNKNIIFELLKKNPYNIELLPQNMKLNKEIICYALSLEDPRASQIDNYIECEMFDDKEFIIEAMDYEFDFTSHCKMDRDIAFNRAKKLGRISENYENDKELVEIAIEKRPFCLKYASDQLRNNYDTVLAAVKRNAYALEFASYDLQNNEELLKIKNKSLNESRNDVLNNIVLYNYEELPEILKNDKEILLKNIETYPIERFYFDVDVPLELRNDKDIALASINNLYYNYNHLPEELKNDSEFNLKAIKANYKIYKYLNEEYKNDKKFVLSAMQMDSNLYYILPRNLQKDEDIYALHKND